MVRKLSLAVALALGVAPFGARALGLGDIQLNSALNQYLNADIKLLSANVEELDGIQVTLGSSEAFERAGVDRAFELTYLTFKPVLLPDGTPVVRVASREPIREPFLNFIVEMNWPKGRMIREYTLLLDPPVTVDRRPPPVATTALSPKPTIVRSQPAATRDSVSRVAPEGGTYGPIRRNDTLWGIATRVRHQGATMPQTMMSLFQANPQAFIDQDINRIKAGEVLRVPSRDEVLTLAASEAGELYRQALTGVPPQPARQPEPPPVQPQEAEATVQEQPAQQVAPADEAEPETPAAEEAQQEPADGAAEAVPEAELKIAAAESDAAAQAAGEAVETPAGGTTAEELAQDLALAQEARETAKIEGEELRSRVADLESQLEDMKRLLELKSEQLASMQATIAGGGAAPGVAPTEESTEAPAEPGSEEPAETPEAAPEPTVSDEPPARPVMESSSAPQTAQPRREQSLIERLTSDTTTVGAAIAGLVVLLSLLWVMISRRRSSSADFQESILVNTVDESETQAMPRTKSSAAKRAEESSFLSDFSASDIDALQDETGEVDPIAEADVYIAYGRYRQAEELVRQAIEREPKRGDLVIKLFEILAATKDRNAFIALAESESADGFEQRDAEGWSRVQVLGAGLAPDHPLFAGVEAAGEEDEAGFDLGLDIDLRNQTAGAADTEGAENTEYDLDVSPLAAAAADGTSGATAPVDEEARSLEFEELELPATPKEDDAAETGEQISGFDLGFEPVEPAPAGSGEAEVEEIPSVIGAEEVSDVDEVNTKLDLARAYVEMGDEDDAREILQEVLAEGDDDQRREAQEILDGLA